MFVRTGQAVGLDRCCRVDSRFQRGNVLADLAKAAASRDVSTNEQKVVASQADADDDSIQDRHGGFEVADGLQGARQTPSGWHSNRGLERGELGPRPLVFPR